MSLHPFVSRRRRLGNAVTIAAFFVVCYLIMQGFHFWSGDKGWAEFAVDQIPFAVAGIFGLAGLIVYVRGAPKA